MVYLDDFAASRASSGRTYANGHICSVRDIKRGRHVSISGHKGE